MAGLSAFRLPLQRQASETLKCFVNICKSFGAHVG